MNSSNRAERQEKRKARKNRPRSASRQARIDNIIQSNKADMEEFHNSTRNLENIHTAQLKAARKNR
jgi:hypothetical protein